MRCSTDMVSERRGDDLAAESSVHAAQGMTAGLSEAKLPTTYPVMGSESGAASTMGPITCPLLAALGTCSDPDLVA